MLSASWQALGMVLMAQMILMPCWLGSRWRVQSLKVLAVPSCPRLTAQRVLLCPQQTAQMQQLQQELSCLLSQLEGLGSGCCFQVKTSQEEQQQRQLVKLQQLIQLTAQVTMVGRWQV